MRSLALVIALCACKPSARPGPVAGPTAPVDAAVEDVEPGAASAVVSLAGARRHVIESPHGGEIVTLAATADGGAAITCDELSGVRLWPTLDGTREPRVVDLPRPRALALAADPRGFLVAMVDQVGGLVLQLVDRDGLALQRAVLDADPAFDGVVMTAGGPLAWRADEVVVRVTAAGTIAEALPAEPGQRILAIAVAGPRAVAVVEAGTPVTRRARWLTLAPALGWGGWIDAGDDVGTVVALSPSGARLAHLLGDRATNAAEAVVIDVRTGGVLATHGAGARASIGFVDDDHLAIGTSGLVTLVAVAAVALAPSVRRKSGDLVDPGLLAVGGGRAIGASNGELVLAAATPAGQTVAFLGYDLETPTVVAAGGAGQLLVGVRDTFALLDRELRSAAAPSLGLPPDANVGALAWVGDEKWLVQYAGHDGATTLAVADLATRQTRTLRARLPVANPLRYEPTTRLVTLSLGAAPEVARLDAGGQRLEAPSKLPRVAGFDQTVVVPVAPELANGARVVVVRMSDRMTIRWSADPSRLDRGPSVTLAGSFAAADRAGHVYVWENVIPHLELVTYRDGKRVRALEADGPLAVWPDPTGERVVVVDRQGVALRLADGTRPWAVPLATATEVLWLPDQTIAFVTSNGIARLDAATGALLAARCGWRFGLSKTPHPITSRSEPVCAQLR